MNADHLLKEILSMLYQVKESKDDLQKIHNFLIENFINEENDDLFIPEQHRKTVAEIAENIQCGFIGQVDEKTVTITSLQREDIYGYGEDEIENEEEDETMEDIKKWEDVITISPPESFESFRIMEDFATALNESPLKRSLISALQRKKPFANFNSIIHNAPERDDWFAFRQHALEQHVAGILIAESAWEIQ